MLGEGAISGRRGLRGRQKWMCLEPRLGEGGRHRGLGSTFRKETSGIYFRDLTFSGESKGTWERK